MGARIAASGVFGALFVVVVGVGPTFVVRSATAKIVESRRASSATNAQEIVQAPAEAMSTSARAAADEPEHSEGSLHLEVVESAVDAAPVPKWAAKRAAPVSEPKTPAAPGPEVAGLRLAVAQQLETLPICRRGGGPEGPGLAEVTFSGDGRARVGLSDPYANTPVGACVARRLAGAAMPFEGAPVTVKVRFEL